MRSTTWFRILGAVAFGILLTNGILTAHADNEFEAGDYEGMIALAIHSWTSQHISMLGLTYQADVSINWIGEGKIELGIKSDSVGEATIGIIPVDVFDAAGGEAKGQTINCFASVGIKTGGDFHGSSTSFIPTQKLFTATLDWRGPSSVDIVYENAQGCPYVKSMSNNQLTAINLSSQSIKNINLKVTNIGHGFISGNCTLPGWEGSGTIPNGSYHKVIDSCYWWAKRLSKVGGSFSWRDL